MLTEDRWKSEQNSESIVIVPDPLFPVAHSKEKKVVKTKDHIYRSYWNKKK